MYLITRILFSAMVLLVVERLIDGVAVESVYIAIIAAIILGFLNAVVRPILVVLTLPVSILTLGLFVFVINALLFMFAASFLQGFSVAGFWPALWGSIIMTVGGIIGGKYIKR